MNSTNDNSEIVFKNVVANSSTENLDLSAMLGDIGSEANSDIVDCVNKRKRVNISRRKNRENIQRSTKSQINPATKTNGNANNRSTKRKTKANTQVDSHFHI